MRRFVAFLLTAAVLGVCTVMLTGAAARLRTAVVSKRSYVHLGDASGVYGMRVVANSRARTEIAGGPYRVVFFPDKRYCFFNNIRLLLSYAPTRRGNDLYISRIDYDTLLAPLLGSKKAFRHPIATIMIDPGHGGRDQGAAGRFSLEKNITLRLARRVAEILRACGYRVVLTRNSDATLSLEQRSRLQQQNKADVFLSLHVNAAADRSVSGIETYCLTPVGAPSSNSTTVGWQKNSGNGFDRNNILLAYNVQRSLLRRTQGGDRGVKRARFAVLRDIRCPGVLVEVGFISHNAEERNLGSAAYIEKLARGISDGVINYHRGMQK